jgi:hypothetical protein
MTIQEVQRIEGYLKSKKLSKPLFLELKDHFIIQIENEMDENNLDFENAFLKVKFKWKNELQMVKADFFSFKLVAKIEKDYLQNIFKKILLSSIGVSILLGIVTWEFPDADFFIKFPLFLVYLCLGIFALFTKKLNFIELWQVGFQPISLKILVFILVIPFGILFLAGEKYPFDNNNFVLCTPLLAQIQLIYYQIKNYKVML